MNKLFYEVESDYLDLKNRLLGFDSYITIKDFLDRGFNNSYIYLKVEEDNIPTLKRFNLGYKESINGGYHSKDFSLNDKQLKCKIRMEDIDSDSDNFTIIVVSLKNQSDKRYFVNSKGVI